MSKLDELARRALATHYPELDRLELLDLIATVKAADEWLRWDDTHDYANTPTSGTRTVEAKEAYRLARSKLEGGG